MSSETLSRDQLKFLEECNFEFCDRYTDSDIEYKKTYDSGTPPPPIMYPWEDRRNNRFNNRDRPGGSRYSNQSGDYHHDRRDYRYNNNSRPGGSEYNRREGHHNYNRYRPY